jgi:hypothetical protein
MIRDRHQRKETYIMPLNYTPLVPTPNGDYIWICAACDHAISGFDAREASLDEYTRETLEGSLYILTHMTPGTKLAPLSEPDNISDSNLLSSCDCCKRPHETFEFYSSYQAVTI